MASREIYTERTNLWTVIGAIIIGVIGVFLLILAENLPWLIGFPSYQAVVRELGALFVASGTISLGWELLVKRAFLAELLNKARLAEEIRESGIIQITKDFYRDIDWPQLLGHTKELDIFFVYGRTWRSSNLAALRALALHRDARIRVVLPDPDDDAIVSELARRFNKTADDVKQRIRNASDEFIRIYSQTLQATADFSKWYVPISPLLTLYRFDNVAVLTLYQHSIERGDIPTFLVEKGGTIYSFLQNEFNEFIIEPGSRGRKIYPPAQEKAEV